MDQKDVNEAEWRDPRNWRGGWLGIYHAPRDARVWVPKRVPVMGFTVNFARAGAWWTVIGLFSLAVAVALLVRLLSV